MKKIYYSLFLILLIGCHSDTYLEAVRLPREIGSIPELQNILTDESLKKSEIDYIDNIIDDILIDKIESLPIETESISSLNELKETLILKNDVIERIDSLVETILTNEKESKRSKSNEMKEIIANEFIDSGDLEFYISWVDREMNKGYIDDNHAEDLKSFVNIKYEKILDNDKKSRAWSEGFFVDSFGDKTDQKYLKTESIGTFSNSATVDSKLGVDIIYSEKAFDIRLYEYGFDKSNNATFIGTRVRLGFRNEKGETIFFDKKAEGGNVLKGFYISNENRDYRALINYFNKSEEIRAVIESSSSKYNFMIDAKYFEVY